MALVQNQQRNIQATLQDLGAPEHQGIVLLPTTAYAPGTTKFIEIANYKKTYKDV